jgi:hypothetical protein
MNVLLVLATLAGCSGPQLAPATTPVFNQARAADIAADQFAVISWMLSDTPAADTDVLWLPCGQDNGFYYLPSGPIVLCLELNDTPAAVFAAAHEAGHALVSQMGLKVDQDRAGNERAADELAALFLIEMGRPDDVVGGAKWFMRDMARKGDGVHPAARDRVRDLLCLVDGAEGGSFDCQLQYILTLTRWSFAINDALSR